jgi:hypothetical protein
MAKLRGLSERAEFKIPEVERADERPEFRMEDRAMDLTCGKAIAIPARPSVA